MVKPPLRGGPDWSPCSAQEFKEYSSGDLEVVARDWWPWAYVLTGEVFFYDDFEAPVLHWTSGATLGSSAVKLVGHAAASGAYSLALSLDDVNNATAFIHRYFDAPIRHRMGYTMFFSCADAVSRLELQLTAVYNELVQFARLRLLLLNGTVSLMNSGGTYTDIGILSEIQPGIHTWNYLKLVVDYDESTYVLVESGRNQISSSLALQTGAAGSTDIPLYCYLEARNMNDGDNTVYVDNVILTGDEP